jgi:ribosomal protein L15
MESWYHAQGLEPIGKTGMRVFRREPVVKNNPLNLKELDQKIDGWVLDKLATKEADVYSVDLEQLGYTKLLSEGKLTRKIQITCSACSEEAKKKVEAASGKVIVKTEE